MKRAQQQLVLNATSMSARTMSHCWSATHYRKYSQLPKWKCTSGVSSVCQMQKLYVNFITLFQLGSASISPFSPLNIIWT